MKLRLACILLALFSTATIAQEATQETAVNDGRLLIIYDSSNSMWGELADKSRKYEAGREALGLFMNSGLGKREIGFRAYGHRSKDDCRDSELVVPFGTASKVGETIGEAVTSIRPTGKTPISHSLGEGLKDLGGSVGDILLISDGIETCDADPCELMREWQAADINIRVHVVGVGLNDMERTAMACIANESGGQYFDAESAEGFAEALTGAGAAIETVAKPKPVQQPPGYAMLFQAIDKTGRSFVATGKIYKDGQEVGKVTSNGRNVLEGPGDYEIEVGPVLADGSIFKPVRQSFTADTPGDTKLEVLVTRPAIVTSRFIENDEQQRGSLVSVFQNDELVFKFRPSDEALARSGEYQFSAEPNDDNKLSVTETLTEGKSTEVVFEMSKTIEFLVRFEMPNGERFRRGAELWRNGEKLYSVLSGNPNTVIPGVYELRSDDQNLPLTPVDIDIQVDGETIVVPIAAGYVTISYVDAPDDYVRGKAPKNASLESLDRGNSKYASLNKPIPVAPGRYKVKPRIEYGDMDSQEIIVANDQSVAVTFIPKPLGQMVVNYAPSDAYAKDPDRAFAAPLEKQLMLQGNKFLVPGTAEKFVPGRYKITGQYNVAPQDVVVTAGETTTITLKAPEQ